MTPCFLQSTPNSPVLQSARPRAVDSGEAKMRIASWENVDKQMPRKIRNNTWACFKWPKNVDKTTSHWNTQYIITIYIHYKSIYFKIITCIILGLVNSNVFACKTNSAFNDFVDSCVTGKRNRTGARAL